MPDFSRQRQGIGKQLSLIMEGLRTAHPSASNPYWRALPLHRMKRLLVGSFLLASVGGFAANLTMLSAPQVLHGFFWPILIPFVATGILIVRLTKPRRVLLTFLLALAFFGVMGRVQYRLPWLTQPASMRQALLFNAFGIWIGVSIGSRLIMSFLTTEGVAGVRMQTELALAHGIQATLVPQISMMLARFEVFAVSLPSSEMGGDLVDSVEQDGNVVAYVADVSGHGLPAGQLMGMLKTAMRLGIELHQQSVTLLENVSRVLPALKRPEMYATLALLYLDTSMEAEYCVAAHPPILHYRKNRNEVVLLTMKQLPIGLLPDSHYTSARTPYSSGDLFIILTDGIVEIANEQDEEFGFDRIQSLVLNHAAEPLPSIWEAILRAANAHGPQEDDQSALLVRVH